MAISPVYALRKPARTLAQLHAVDGDGHHDRRFLWLFGGFFLFNYAVDNATQRWEGGIEFVVWMNPRPRPNRTRTSSTRS